MMKKKFREQLTGKDVFAMHQSAIGEEFAPMSEAAKQVDSLDDGVAIIDICGPLEHHASFMWDSYDSILERLECAFADPDIGKVVMRIDSPGGDAAGATEANRNIRKLKEKYEKPLYAYSDESMYSAAYSIGCAADEIWVPTTGGVGSVGVICAAVDKTKQNEKLGINIKLVTTGARKADSHPDRELTDEVLESLQNKVNYLGNVFFETVAECRGMKVSAVESLQAGCFMGADAVASGLADAVGGWYEFLSHVSESQNMPTKMQLKKEKDELAKKIAACKSSAERTTLLAAFEAKCSELASIKTVTEKKTVEKDDDSSGKLPDDEDDEDGEEEKAEEEDEPSDEEKAEEEEEEEEESDAKSLSLSHVQKLLSAASKATGKRNASEIIGALEGMQSHAQMAERLAKLEQSSRREKVKAMLDKASREGRVPPSAKASLESQGMKDPKWLKGYLSALPKNLRSLEDGAVSGKVEPQTLNAQNLSADQQKMIQTFAAQAGVSVEQHLENIKKYAKNGKL